MARIRLHTENGDIVQVTRTDPDTIRALEELPMDPDSRVLHTHVDHIEDDE